MKLHRCLSRKLLQMLEQSGYGERSEALQTPRGGPRWNSGPASTVKQSSKESLKLSGLQRPHIYQAVLKASLQETHLHLFRKQWQPR